MWIIFSILLIVWVIGIHFYFPGWVSIVLLAALIGVLALALLPARQRSSTYIWKSPHY